MRINDLSIQQILYISEEHINRFEKLLTSNSSYVKKDECQMYLGIWRDIKEKTLKNEILNEVEQNELIDALDSGEYDDEDY